MGHRESLVPVKDLLIEKFSVAAAIIHIAEADLAQSRAELPTAVPDTGDILGGMVPHQAVYGPCHTAASGEIAGIGGGVSLIIEILAHIGGLGRRMAQGTHLPQNDRAVLG